MKDNKKKIAIVDDSMMIGEMLKMHLSKDENLQIKHFTTGEAFLRDQAFAPDLIFLDYHLDSVEEEAMNGLEVLKKINSSIPTIMFSSQNDLETGVELLKNGICDYVIKDDQLLEKAEQSMKEIFAHIEHSQTMSSLQKTNSKSLKRIGILVTLIALMILLTQWFS